MTDTDFDVVIVGAGAVGSLVAAQLASSTDPEVSVLLLEAGPPRSRLEDHVDRYYAANAKIPSAPWPDNEQARRPTVLDIASKETWRNDEFYMRQTGDLPFASTYERLAGGTLNHWLGTALRFLPEDFELASRWGAPGARDWPLGYDDLEDYYSRAEEEIGVSGNHEAWDDYEGAWRSKAFPMREIPPSYLDQQVEQLAGGQTINGREIRVISTPQARNRTWYRGRPPCVGNTSCVPICPVRAKYDPSDHLNVALGVRQASTHPGFPYPEPAPHPARISYRSVAYRVEVDPGGKISAVHYKEWSEDGSVVDKRVTAKTYILCSHAIETAKLLLISPWTRPDGTETTVANSSDQVGRNLMDHTILLMWGLTKEPVYPFRGPLSTSGIGDFRAGKEREQRAAYIIEIGNEGWSWPAGAPFKTLYDLMESAPPGQWFGRPLKTAVHDHISRQIRLAAEFESLPLPGNRVLPARERDALGIPRPEIRYQLSDYVKAGFDDAAKTLSGILEKLGVEEVLHTVNPDSPAVFTTNEGNTYEFRGAGHILGTYRMGSDPADSVVDSYCRSFDHPNLYLMGSGVFPSSGTANPTLTLLALALRSTEQILMELKGS